MVGIRPAQKKRCEAVGEELRVAREHRGLSRETVASQLGIPLKHVEALEAGELGVFSAEVYARGAYGKYAGYIGVKRRQSYHAFWRALSEVREVTPLRLLTPHSWLQRIMTPRLILLGLGGVVAVLLGSYIVWQVQSFLRLPQLALLEPVGGVVESNYTLIRGQTDTTATVKVNGQAVLLQPEGRFEVPLDLQPGINHIEIEAINAAERSRVITKDLLVPRRVR